MELGGVNGDERTLLLDCLAGLCQSTLHLLATLSINLDLRSFTVFHGTGNRSLCLENFTLSILPSATLLQFFEIVLQKLGLPPMRDGRFYRPLVASGLRLFQNVGEPNGANYRNSDMLGAMVNPAYAAGVLFADRFTYAMTSTLAEIHVFTGYSAKRGLRLEKVFELFA
jgi:hypothetical protein